MTLWCCQKLGNTNVSISIGFIWCQLAQWLVRYGVKIPSSAGNGDFGGGWHSLTMKEWPHGLGTWNVNRS